MTIGQKPLRCTASISALAAMIALTSPSQADVTISTGTTQNMSCSGGVCKPTATNAVLNTNDLEVLLESGNATVTTTGSGVQADNIVVAAAVTWTNSTLLTLQANQNILITSPVSVGGQGGIHLEYPETISALSFTGGGHITFSNHSGTLILRKRRYKLVDSIASLIRAVQNNPNPNGVFALAADYDAKKDGTYSTPPVPYFSGTFEGLGNTISHFAINDSQEEAIGFFGAILGGVVRDVGLKAASVYSSSSNTDIGALAGVLAPQLFRGSASNGVIFGSWSTGSVSAAAASSSQIGGLVGKGCAEYLSDEGLWDYVLNSHSSATVSGGADDSVGGLVGSECSAGGGEVENSYATGTVAGENGAHVGGLIGSNIDGEIEVCFATGSATTGNSDGSVTSAGGLIGSESGSYVLNSYSTGSASGGSNTNVGGMIGYDNSGVEIQYSYSTGAPTAGPSSYVGGFMGYDGAYSIYAAYWDTDLSGITNLSQGAGNESNAAGITGLSTSQLESGLPAGFDPTVWAENSSINNGFPYLIANPPPQ